MRKKEETSERELSHLGGILVLVEGISAVYSVNEEITREMKYVKHQDTGLEQFLEDGRLELPNSC